MDEQQSQPPSHQNPQQTTPPPSPTHVEGTERGEQFEHQDPMWGKEPGRKDTGSDDTPAQRPTGESTGRDSTKLDPKNPTDPQSPHIPAP
jgi:hypothetical protein